MGPMGIAFQALDNRRVELERHRENSSRMAEVEAHFRTTGLGSIEFETRVDFGVTFVTKPVCSYGSELDIDALERVLEAFASSASLSPAAKKLLLPGGNSTPMLPMASGFVTDWDSDSRGYYTGAWCGARVYYPPLTADVLPVEVVAPVVLEHHFRFSAVGMKDVPTQLTD